MPHADYSDENSGCPWPGCRCLIRKVDLELERMGKPAFYARVVLEWGRREGYGLIGRCPDCRRHVVFGVDFKAIIADPDASGLPILPDDWHLNAYIESIEA